MNFISILEDQSRKMEKKTRNGHGSIIGLCNTNKKDNLSRHNTKGKTTIIWSIHIYLYIYKTKALLEVKLKEKDMNNLIT